MERVRVRGQARPDEDEDECSRVEATILEHAIRNEGSTWKPMRRPWLDTSCDLRLARPSVDPATRSQLADLERRTRSRNFAAANGAKQQAAILKASKPRVEGTEARVASKCDCHCDCDCERERL